jgi:hypothetical protein
VTGAGAVTGLKELDAARSAVVLIPLPHPRVAKMQEKTIASDQFFIDALIRRSAS